MSWMDEEIDNVFKEAANQPTFEYRPEYWKDIEKQLPVNKKKKLFVWWWTAGIFIVGIIGIGVFSINGNSVNQKNAHLSDAIESKEIQNTNNKSTDKSNNNRVLQKTNNAVLDHQNKPSNAKKEANSIRKASIDPAKQFPNVIESQTITNMIPIAELKVEEVNLPKVLLNETQNENFDVVISDNKEIGLKTKSFIYNGPIAELIRTTPIENKNQLSSYYFELNGGIGQEYTFNDPSDVNAIYGASFGISLPVKQFTFTAGLGYQGTNFSNLNIKDRTLIYGFGSKILENSYTFSSIHALTLPVAFSYSLNRHSLSLGITTSLNFLTRLKHSQSLDGERTLYESGVSDVSFFNRFSLQPSFGYSYFVNENTQIGARINIELINQLKSDRFIGEHTNLPFNGQVYLRRTIVF